VLGSIWNLKPIASEELNLVVSKVAIRLKGLWHCGNLGHSFFILNLSTVFSRRCQVVRFTPQSVYPGKTFLNMHCTMGWVGLRADLDLLEKICLLLLPGIEGRVLSHSARSLFSTQNRGQARGIVILSTPVLYKDSCNSRTGS
jgi:hypothetical protein